MKFLLLALALLAPQSELPEYGDLSELKEARRVYVTADDLDSRKLLLSELKRYKGLEFLDSPDGAEFVLEYSTKASTEALGRRRTHYARAQLVAFRLTDKGRRRILWSENETMEQSGGFMLSRPNEINLARNFVKELRKARGEKK